MATRKPDRWFTSKSAVRGHVKVPEDPRLAGYFYCGPSKHFGHYPPRKAGKKK
jgi:hypothetical protein